MDNKKDDFSPKLKMYNVILLGGSFLLMFTGFQTCGMVSQTVLNSYINITSINGTATFSGSGYTSLAIIYIVFAFANWLAPSIVSVLGPKYSMFVGGLAYTFYLTTFLKPMAWLLYTASVVIGFGAAIIWTGQGNFLTINSDDQTMGRNSGIFWAMLQCSLLIGNVYVFIAWRGITIITDKQRVPLFIVLSAVCLLGTLSLLLLRSHPRKTHSAAEVANSGSTECLIDSEELDEEYEAPVKDTETDAIKTVERIPNRSKSTEAWDAFLASIRLFKKPEMLLLSVTFFYTGLELTFFSGVYSTSVGATKKFGADSDKLVGLTGIMIGVGEILGGGLFGILGKKTVQYGRDPIVVLGGVLHLVTFFLIFLNIPDDAPINKQGSEDIAYISPNTALAVACGFLLGFADACFNTQCYSILGSTYSDNSAAAFALFKFEQSFAAAIGFFYSSYLLLKWQLLLLVVFGFAGVLCFLIVERKVKVRVAERSYSTI